MIADLAIAETRKEIEHFCGLGSRVIDQSRRRVLNGEQVPTAEKIYSIFEPHTDLIKRGKVQTPIEFGHKVFLAESARGLITQYEVLDGNPVDEQQWLFRWNATGRPSATSPTCMDRIAASSAKRT
jgi:IS5 family transposase